ncbi:MAG: DUF4961 domain-containing protein [Chitinophagaceae bacterium]|nr:MAG: DUF4961 domain-containing protein [Chitinophagaceae bacterium]
MKFLPFKKRWFTVRNITAFFFIAFFISCTMTIDTVEQPMMVKGGDILPVTLKVTITTNEARTAKFMVGLLVPKAWNVQKNTTVTFTSTITSGDQPMSVIPAGTPAPNGNGLDWPGLLAAKVGNGGNLINDYEWVAFYSDAAYTVAGNATVRVEVKIRTKVSNDNIAFKLGYCVAQSVDGLNGADYYGTHFTSCFRVEGDGDLVDFCNPQLATIEPRNALDNDIITLNFDSKVSDNALSNTSDVYLCATGITTDGERITTCVQNEQSKLKAMGLGRYQKDIWPRQFFSLKPNQILRSIEYYFTDGSGAIKVGYGGGADPFPFTFKCQ